MEVAGSPQKWGRWGRGSSGFAAARRVKIPITTFMITSDPYLQKFVEEFTEVNQGKAYYSGLKGLGHLVFEDYKKNRRKSL